MENNKIKFAASQAKSIYLYKTLRSKILKCNVYIFFNIQCLDKNIIPNYGNIKIPSTSKAAHITYFLHHILVQN